MKNWMIAIVGMLLLASCGDSSNKSLGSLDPKSYAKELESEGFVLQNTSGEQEIGFSWNLIKQFDGIESRVEVFSTDENTIERVSATIINDKTVSTVETRSVGRPLFESLIKRLVPIRKSEEATSWLVANWEKEKSEKILDDVRLFMFGDERVVKSLTIDLLNNPKVSKQEISLTDKILKAVGMSKSTARVNGSIDNADGQMIYLEELSSMNSRIIDSCSVMNNGKFQLSTDEMKHPGFYRLLVDKNNYVILLLDKGETAEVSGNALDFYRSYEVAGSEGSTKLRMLDARLRKDYELQDSLRKSFMQFQAQGHPRLDSISQSIDAVFQSAQREKLVFVKEFIDQNPNSLATLSAVQSVRYDENPELFDQVASNLQDAYPNSDYVKQFKKQVVDLKAKQQAAAKTGIGAQAPEIVVQTPEGETIKLSDFRGKVTLIDFWAAWCKPCRAENPNVVRLYNQYKDKGFEIFGVSLDQDKEKWIQAIKQDGLTWKHGSELRFWQSSFVPAYNLDGIPMTYLLDENGVIIAKGLRGQQLEAKLQEIFG